MVDFQYEDEAVKKGYKTICGIDEAGRGPLFGSVCAAAVILPENFEFDGIDDSKKLTPKKRAMIYEYIIKNAVSYGIGYASAEEIDEVNILNATYMAMERAYNEMPIKADFALIDGNRISKDFPVPANTIIKGDSKSVSIAAASILAKVSRDSLMEEFDKKYPDYNFLKHKGYPTVLHYECILKYGILPEHRKTFLKNLESKRK